jgi:hypothetical protein
MSINLKLLQKKLPLELRLMILEYIDTPKQQVKTEPFTDEGGRRPFTRTYDTWGEENSIVEYMRGAEIFQALTGRPPKSEIEQIIKSTMEFTHTENRPHYNQQTFNVDPETKYDFFDSGSSKMVAAQNSLKEGLDILGKKHPNLAQDIVNDVFTTFPKSTQKPAHILKWLLDSPHEGVQLAILKQASEGPLYDGQKLSILAALSKTSHANVHHEMWRLVQDPNAFMNKADPTLIEDSTFGFIEGHPDREILPFFGHYSGTEEHLDRETLLILANCAGFANEARCSNLKLLHTSGKLKQLNTKLRIQINRTQKL